MRKHKSILDGYLFLLPSLFLFAVFAFFPLIFSFILSFTKWELISDYKPFIGLKNYINLFTDVLFYKVLLNTFVFSFSVVLLSASLGLFLALLVNRKIVGTTLFRAGIFMPYLTSTAAMALVWLWIFDPKYGLINSFLMQMGLTGPEWLASTTWALPAIIIMTIWRFVGYNMLLFLGGLQNIPQTLIEAAKIDGANSVHTFTKITLPLLSPTTLFVLITTFLTMFQNFETIYVMTQGGPVNSTNMIVFYLYQNAFQIYQVGYASTIAIVLFAIVGIITLIQIVASKNWVHYA